MIKVKNQPRLNRRQKSTPTQSGLKVKMNAGFTLAEMLAVISIFVVISGIVTSIIYSTLRSSTKTKIVTEVSQNGQFAVSRINDMISDSRNIIAVNGTSIEDCTLGPATASHPIATVNPPTPAGVKPSLTLRRIDGGITVISCENATIASNGASLINKSLVQASACSFQCSQLVNDPYSIPIVKFSFDLSQTNTSNFAENQSKASFSSSTSLRTYSP